MGSEVRTDRAGLAKLSMSQRKGGYRNWQKDDENKRKKNKQKSQAAMLWFCCNPSSIELCFSPHYVNKKNNSHKERQVPRIRAISH